MMNTDFWHLLCTLNKEKYFDLFASKGIKEMKDLRILRQETLSELNIPTDDWNAIKQASFQKFAMEKASNGNKNRNSIPKKLQLDFQNLKENNLKKRRLLSSSSEGLQNPTKEKKVKKAKKEKKEKKDKEKKEKPEKQKRVKLVNLFKEGMISEGQEVTFRGCKGVISHKGSILYSDEEFYTPSGWATKVCRDLGGSSSTRPNGWEVVFLESHKLSSLRKLYKLRMSPSNSNNVDGVDGVKILIDEELKISSEEEEKEKESNDESESSHKKNEMVSSFFEESPNRNLSSPSINQNQPVNPLESNGLDFLAQVSLVHNNLRSSSADNSSGDEFEQKK